MNVQAVGSSMQLNNVSAPSAGLMREGLEVTSGKHGMPKRKCGGTSAVLSWARAGSMDSLSSLK
jgi:hypothetical protein